MKGLIKRLISRAVKNDLLWTWFDATVLRLARYAERARHARGNELEVGHVVESAIKALFPDLAVRHGIFEGMKYPEPKSVGSALFPKLLGSYEREIHPVLERICKQGYTEIVDIGCAEGYYAVGLAIRIPTARVFAYDIDEEAIRLCMRMAQLNKVEHRVITGSFCTPDMLKRIPFTGKGLIVCDCEGYEMELFSADVAPFLARHDLLIEVHDFINIRISSTLRRLFEKTHDIEVVESLDDIKKANTYAYREIEGYDLPTRKILLGEFRPAIMEWFYLKARNEDVRAQELSLREW